MSVELVLAPGVTNSASSLSYPCANESLNKVIKALVYIRAGDEDEYNFSVHGAYGVFDVNINFRKWLHLASYFNSAFSSVFSGLYWGCRCRSKYYVGT